MKSKIIEHVTAEPIYLWNSMEKNTLYFSERLVNI